MTMGRATVTFNRRRFIRLHTAVPSHAGIVVCTRDDDVAASADRIHRQLQSTPTLQGHLLRINRPSSSIDPRADGLDGLSIPLCTGRRAHDGGG